MDESFLPYAMIEPLLTPGMTLRELGDLIRRRLELPFEGYAILVSGSPMETVASKVRRGCRIVKRGSVEHKRARFVPNEPVR